MKRKYFALKADGNIYQPLDVTNGVPWFQRYIDYFIRRHDIDDVYLDNVTVGRGQAYHDANLS